MSLTQHDYRYAVTHRSSSRKDHGITYYSRSKPWIRFVDQLSWNCCQLQGKLGLFPHFHARHTGAKGHLRERDSETIKYTARCLATWPNIHDAIWHTCDEVQ